VALANPAVTSVLGLEPEQVVGLPLEALLPGVDAAEAERRTAQGLYMRSSHSGWRASSSTHAGTTAPSSRPRCRCRAWKPPAVRAMPASCATSPSSA
jgi:hypothetical protein